MANLAGPSTEGLVDVTIEQDVASFRRRNPKGKNKNYQGESKGSKRKQQRWNSSKTSEGCQARAGATYSEPTSKKYGEKTTTVIGGHDQALATI